MESEAKLNEADINGTKQEIKDQDADPINNNEFKTGFDPLSRRM